MTRRFYRAMLIACLLMTTSLLSSAQDDESPDEGTSNDEERVVQLFSSPDTARRFNVPIPEDGWENLSAGEEAHFRNAEFDADIYVQARAGEDAPAAIDSVLTDILDSFDAEPFLVHEVNLGGTIWNQQLYELADGRDVTAFGGVRNGNTYVLAYINAAPDSDYYMLFTRQTGTDPTVADGINESINLFAPDADIDAPTDTDTVLLSNGEWTRHVYDDANLHVIGQLRPGNIVYTVIERGDGELIDGVNKMFFTVFLGFFVTPNNDPYLYLGLAVSVGLVLFLVGSMALRYNNLKQDEATLETLREDAPIG